MFRRKSVIAVVVIAVLIPVAAIGWWLGSPLLMNTTVEEEFPFAFTASVPSDMTMAGVEQVMAGMAKVDQQINEEMSAAMAASPSGGGLQGGKLSDPAANSMIDSMSESMTESMVDGMIDAMIDAMPEAMVGEMAGAAIDAMPANVSGGMKDGMTQDMPKMIKEAASQAMTDAMNGVLSSAMKQAMAQSMPEIMKDPGLTPASPTKLKSGDFSGVDRFHTGSGKATIYRLPDGSSLLRLEDFKVTNGPDLRVILSPVQNPDGAGEVTAPGHLELSKLKGNLGNQNYEIPSDVDITAFQSVVIFCKPFRVIFSVAPLQDIS